MVTVAIRRINVLDKKKPILTDYLNLKKLHICQIQQAVIHQKKHLEL